MSEKSFAERFASKNKGNNTAESIIAKKETNNNLAASQADLVYLVKGVDDGKNAWYYILVERLKLSLFQKALNDDIIHLENYGKILYSAYGDEPPAEITEKLKQEYGVS